MYNSDVTYHKLFIVLCSTDYFQIILKYVSLHHDFFKQVELNSICILKMLT